MSLIIGTSGWSYDDWIGPFYDKKSRMFTRYAEVFRTSEINSTFYSYPTAGMVRGWYRTAPPGFVFATKLPRLITHEKGLRLKEGVEADTDRFLDLMRPLAEKLGPILIQLPPGFKHGEDAETLDKFLGTLQRNYEWAVEFRHRSWMREETWRTLEEHNVAYAIVDEPLLPPETHITADFSYIRWHGRGSRPWYDYDYKPEELEEWIPKVEDAMAKVDKVYGYFNNHFKANAVKNAVELLNMLGQGTPQQISTLSKINEFWGRAPQQKGVKPLEAFIGEEEAEGGEGPSVVDLLMRFTSASRLQRAEEIPDDELTWRRKSGGIIEATIRGYSIEVDPKEKRIRHDCDDWRKGLCIKRMCKHVNKLFLSLPREQSMELLSSIWDERDKWSFE